MSGEQLPLTGTSTRRRKGPTESAAERTISEWRAAGHTVDPLASSLLRGGAGDVDDAERDYRADAGSKFTVTRARSLLLDLYRALAPREVADDVDAFAAIVEQLAGADS